MKSSPALEMQRNPQTQPLFWTIGIVTVFVVVMALVFLRTGTFASTPPTPTATHTPLPVIDLESLPTLITTAVSKTPTPTSTPTASPSATPLPSSKGSGKILFVSDRDGNEEIYVMDSDGSHPTRLTQNPGRDIYPQWSPDGTKIAFLSERENQSGLYIMELDGRNQTLLAASVVLGKGEFSWSPDSTRVAYSSLVNGNADISVINVDGSMEQNLTKTGTQEEVSPSWSPDGTKIAFYNKDRHRYFVMNADGSDQTQVVGALSTNQSQPGWSPDGSYLLTSASNEIFSVDPKTGAVVQLTNNQNYDASPAVSPDGTKIAFVSSRSQGSHEIFIMDAKGEHAQKISHISDTRASISNLLWSAAGDRIIFTLGNYRGGLTPGIFSIDIKTREAIELSGDPSSSNVLSDVAP